MNAVSDVQFRDRLRRNISRTLAFGFFQVFLVIMPVLGLIERPKPRPASITEAVLAKSGHGAPAHAGGGAT